MPHKNDIGNKIYVLNLAISSKVCTVIAAEKPISAKMIQFIINMIINNGVIANFAPNQSAKTTIIAEEIMPRSTAAKIFPATKAIGRIGDTKYSSKDL